MVFNSDGGPSFPLPASYTVMSYMLSLMVWETLNPEDSFEGWKLTPVLLPFLSFTTQTFRAFSAM